MSETLDRPITFDELVAEISLLNKEACTPIHVSENSKELLFRHGKQGEVGSTKYQFLLARILGIVSLCIKARIVRVVISYQVGEEYYDQTVNGPLKLSIEEDGKVNILFHAGRYKLDRQGYVVTETGNTVYPLSLKIHPFLLKGVEFARS